MPYEKIHDLLDVQRVWTLWVQGKRPDLVNLQALADEVKVPISYLYKKTAKWRKALKAQIEQDLSQLNGKMPSRAKREEGRQIGRLGEARINALKPSGLGLVFTDEYRHARKLGKDAMAIAMQGLIEEATTGTGASRVSAIRELLDRAGLAKDKERKDEPSPYEDEGTTLLKERLVALLGSSVGETMAGRTETNPTTSHPPTSPDPITPFPSLAQHIEEVPTPLVGLSASDIALKDAPYRRVMLQ